MIPGVKVLRKIVRRNVGSTLTSGMSGDVMNLIQTDLLTKPHDVNLVIGINFKGDLIQPLSVY